jgi:hypothetical protein
MLEDREAPTFWVLRIKSRRETPGTKRPMAQNTKSRLSVKAAQGVEISVQTVRSRRFTHVEISVPNMTPQYLVPLRARIKPIAKQKEEASAQRTGVKTTGFFLR